MATALADGLGDILLSALKLVHQHAIGQRLFQDVEVGTLDVFDDADVDIFELQKAKIAEAMGKAFDAAVFHGTNAPSDWPDDLVTAATAASQVIDLSAAGSASVPRDLYDVLMGVDGITVLTPRPAELRASITTFRHARADAGKLFGYLAEKHRLRCRPVTEQGLNAVRVSLHVFNSRADAARVIAGVRASARDL